MPGTPQVEQAGLFEAPAPPELDTRERLRVLSVEDPRARFLPATHSEKNWALSLLDYIDIMDPAAGIRQPNRQHPAQTASQLNEVFLFHMKLQKRRYPNDMRVAYNKGTSEGRRALRSITFEFGDFLTNAAEQKTALWQLSRDLDECTNPRVSLAEELGEEYPGLPAFVRFFDLRELTRSGLNPVLGFDPLHTIELREGIDEQYRNKYVEDPYTARDPSPAVVSRVRHVAGALTIGAVRRTITRGNLNLADAAVIDQQNRINFWTARLREARLHGAAKPIAERILNALDIAVK